MMNDDKNKKQNKQQQPTANQQHLIDHLDEFEEKKEGKSQQGTR